MAEQDPEQKRLALLDFLRRQRQQQPEKPEPSYFDRPEPDREKERQAERPRQAIPHVAPPKVEKPVSADRHDPRNTFNRRGDVETLRQDSILAEYKTERQKATALANLEDAAALRQAAQERLDAAIKPINAKWDRIDFSRPVPGEMVLDLKEKERAATETHQKDLAEIDHDLRLSLKAVHTLDVKVSIQTKVHLLEDHRTPDASEHLAIAARNWPQRFSRADDPVKDEERQLLRARVVSPPDAKDTDQSPDIEDAAAIDQSDTDTPEPDDMALYEQYEMDWLSVFEENEKSAPEQDRPDIKGPKPFLGDFLDRAGQIYNVIAS